MKEKDKKILSEKKLIKFFIFASKKTSVPEDTGEEIPILVTKIVWVSD
jgi:hypothetical protein